MAEPSTPNAPNRTMQFFVPTNSPKEIIVVSERFFELASWIDENQEDSKEKDKAIYHLLQAKYYAVRTKPCK